MTYLGQQRKSLVFDLCLWRCRRKYAEGIVVSWDLSVCNVLMGMIVSFKVNGADFMKL